MGVISNIGIEIFPKQGAFLNKEVNVCFNYNTTKLIKGLVVRDDAEKPFHTIIKLEDGRYVMSTECQYTLI